MRAFGDVTSNGTRAALASYADALVPRSLSEAAPGLAVLVRYPRSYVRSDLVGGVTVGAVAVPSSLAMAELAGLPVVYGLYGTFLPLAVYGLLGAWANPIKNGRVEVGLDIGYGAPWETPGDRRHLWRNRPLLLPPLGHPAHKIRSR